MTTTTSRLRSSLLALGAMLLGGVVAAQLPAPRDRVVLVDGKELKGRVVRENDDEVLLRIGSVDRPIPRRLVREVHSTAARHRALLRDWRDVDATDVDGLLRLAARADQERLPHEARLLRWYAVLQRPDDKELHATLGNRAQGAHFLVALGDRKVPFAHADALGTDFVNAWRLRSEHFELRCAGGLRAGLDALLDLEHLYHAVHELFGAPLGMLELTEPVPVRLYRDRAQMPQQSATIGAYYKPDEATLFTCLEHGRAYALHHEAVHALLHHTFGRASRSKGELPAWLDEGWAEYMTGRLQTRVPGKPVLLAASVLPGHQAALAAADDRLGLHRVLNLQQGDFQASTGQALKYAQAWALFRFLFEHPDAALRAQFVDYLQQAAAGRGQASTFRKRFAAHERTLEQAWQ